ncbi:MAG: nuclear transport factor 2 family protein [Oscillospiraceae bacterium]|nr:nuclear transport factor 2 family protein [Oscillospiraceae bacterium]
MKNEEAIAECYKNLYKAMIEKDGFALSELLDESFVLVHMTGMRQSKDAFIRAVENGTLNYYSAQHQNIDVEIDNAKAVLTGQSLVNAAVFGGGRHTWHLQLKIDLIEMGGKWLMTEAKASTY